MNEYDRTKVKSAIQHLKVFIFSSDSNLHKLVQEQLTDSPLIKLTPISSTPQFWDALLSSICDLLILDDRILASGDDTFLTGLRNLSTPVVMIQSHPDIHPPSLQNHRIIRTIRLDEISTLTTDDLLCPIQMHRQDDLAPLEPSVNAVCGVPAQFGDSKVMEHILKSSPGILFIWDIVKREFSFINDAAIENLGYSFEEINSMKPEDWAGVLSSDHLDRVLNHFKGFTEQKDQMIIQNEYHLRDKRNRWRWFRSNERIFERNPDGTARSIIVAMEDVTEYRLAQDRLEKRFRREELFAAMAIDFLSIDPDQYQTRIGEAINHVRMLIGCNALVVYEQNGTLLNRVFESTASGKSSTLPEQIDTDDNLIFSAYLLNKKPFLLESGTKIEPDIKHTFSRIFGENLSMAAFFPLTYQDTFLGAVLFTPMEKMLHWSNFEISVAHAFSLILSGVMHHINAERILSNSTGFWWGPDRSVTKLVCQFDRNHKITYVNDVLCDTLGINKNDVIGHNPDFLIPSADNASFQVMLSSMNKNNLVINVEFDFTRSDGKIFNLDWICRGFMDEQGEIKEYQMIGRDITGNLRERSEFTLEQTHQVQTARLRSISELATGVAHQISNPLTTIIAEAQILTHELTSDHPARESAEAILEAGWQAQDVIRVLKQISEYKEDRIEHFSVNDTIAGALSLTSEYLQSANTGIFTDFEPDIPDIKGNSRDLIDIWVNFLLLAHSAARAGRVNQVEISTRFLSPEWIEIVFQNNGRVFMNENQDTLFEPQAIPDPAKIIHGFELLICREIINRHQGTLSIESSDFSTIFQVRLPKGHS